MADHPFLNALHRCSVARIALHPARMVPGERHGRLSALNERVEDRADNDSTQQYTGRIQQQWPFRVWLSLYGRECDQRPMP